VIQSSKPASPDEVAAHYDALDSFYREIWGEHVHHGLWRTGRETRAEAAQALCEAVADELGLSAGACVCDVGCGYGATARFLANVRGFDVTGVTISRAQCEFARSVEPGAANPQYVAADWLTNELPDGSFDGAIAVESSEHMPSLRGFFQQAHRVLRADGRLVVTAWLAAEAASAWQRRILLEPICREGRMPAMSTAGEYGRAAELERFELLRFQDWTREVAPTWPGIAWTFVRTLVGKPRYFRILLHARNWAFAVAAVRLTLAYRGGAMRYGVFTFRAV
jgi:tocopherol O-methyltransferase